MVDRAFYNNDVCLIPAEGRNLIVKQANGIKYSAVGAVLFSDVKNSIKSAYESDKENLSILKNITLEQLKNYTTIVYNNLSYTLEGGVIIPDNYNQYNNALNDKNHLFNVQIAYDSDSNDEKYISYDFVLDPASVSVKRVGDLNFDGFAILGLPYKPIKTEESLPILTPQNYAILAFVYFPLEDQKFQILNNQPKNVAMNYEVHVYSDFVNVSGLSYITHKGLEPKNPQRFLFGLHMTNDGKHNRG